MNNNQSRFKIAPFDGSDASYAAVAAIGNAIYPEYPDAPADLKRRDSKRLPKYHFARFVAGDSHSDSIVAYGDVGHDSESYHAQKFEVEIFVEEAFEGLGIGRNLYNHILDHLTSLNPTVLEAVSRTDKLRGIRFLEDRGFELKSREYSSKLDLNLFDPAAFASYSTRCQEAGVAIIDHNQLKARFPDDWTRRLHAANVEIALDVPWHDTVTPAPYEEWVDRHLSHAHRIPETYLLAMDGDDIVGTTMVFKSDATPDMLFTGMTGVKRSHRRKGVAVALKAQSLGWAKANLKNSLGTAPSVMTENEANNPMYTINERMGFVRQPDFLMYRKEVGKEEGGKGAE